MPITCTVQEILHVKDQYSRNFELLNHLMAEPSDQDFVNFFLYKTQPYCVGLLRKVDTTHPLKFLLNNLK